VQKALVAGPADERTRAEAVFSQIILRTDSSGRLPQFLGWKLRDDFCKAAAQPKPAMFRALNPSLFSLPASSGTTTAPARIFEEPKFYNSISSDRMCVPVVPGSGVNLYNSGVYRWWYNAGHKEMTIDAAYAEGAIAVAPVFLRLAWEEPNPSPLVVRYIQNGSTKNRNVWINVPKALENKVVGNPAICHDVPLRPRTQTAGQKADYNLDDFYWIQVQKPLMNADQTDGSCGDIFLLVGLNLMKKEAAGWLWSTLLWEDDSWYDQPQLHRLPKEHDAAGNPAAWTHYVVDATTGVDNILFNPYKLNESTTSNCQHCHERGAMFGGGTESDKGHGNLPPIASPVLHSDMVFAPSKLTQDSP
jgi:hypothetical protein